MAFDLDSALGIHAQALALRSRRSEVLASNLANVDTPNYKARDIDFAGVLGRARETQPGGGFMKVSHTAHLRGLPGDGSDGALMYRIPLQASVDGNTVDSQIEQAEFTRNAVQYMASLQFLNGRITGLLRALRGE